jgi:Cys-Gly metallodipeptidase DUG1
MEESGSEGLDDVIKQEANGYFKDVDVVCISDNCKWMMTEFVILFWYKVTVYYYYY